MSDSNCIWSDCRNPPHAEMPICFAHAYLVHREVDELLVDTKPPAPKTHLVYYLAISPNTVKIGTTTDLIGRMRGLRTDVQYVLAVEPGGRDVERQRHVQFAADRIGRREDFRVSEALQMHISQLADVAKAERATRDKARR
jgi:hypothetical protein